ncbi:MAG: hypothetical protein JEZ09_03125 [Salinivirgaceae bacterium]|nr:hypothetical protein [Salinivirgaceae bacterium]
MNLIRQILHPVNLARAQKRVIANNGSVGVHEMKVSELVNLWLTTNKR